MSSEVERRLDRLGLAVPDVTPPLAAYRPAVGSGRLVWTAGQIPLREGALVAAGKVGLEVDLDTARVCAQQCALNAIAAVRNEVGDLDLVDQIVKVVVFVASAPHFTDQAVVANGASELLQAAFGAGGVHARSAVGVAVLPLDASVEVELVASVARPPRVDQAGGKTG
ncbi:RidA family protein [Aeromicrobium terrae]|uniref:RidA family protein n=1 Tax=Aeromicrobium terrae TaxID=2498846 RepID=A0A5C8NHV5_9ACTN|nr:RidA family protein [Aeromicrobium terrae]TXL60742.1 RidA family protein [Aeromicrobium terrae]